jgi:Arylsulfotransferase (ASST)
MSRRRLRFSFGICVILVGASTSVGVAVAWRLWFAAGSRAAAAPVSVFPFPGARVASPQTQITFRGVPAAQLGAIQVAGSVTGVHPGAVLSHSDGRGASFVPSTPFRPGERVTVSTGLNVIGGARGSFSFTVAQPSGTMPTGKLPAARRVRGDVLRFASRGFAPAAVTVNRRPSRHAENGGIFVAPQQGPVQVGPMILGPDGGLVWFQPARRGDSVTDFRVQSYQGKPVLTWWQGNSAGGVGQGFDEIYDSSYRPIATVGAGNGLRADLHEFQITPQNTALITAYYPVFWDASSVKGARRQIVVDSVVQEIDIPTGLVLFQWNSLDHVPLSETYARVGKSATTLYNAFHINSVHEDSDGNLVISDRNTWAVYKISHQTGATLWRLGGKRSSFRMGKNTTFAFQHDARPRANGEITIFDDGAGPPVVHKQSRALTLKLNTKNMTATLAHQNEHRPPLLAAFEGNVQNQPNGDEFVGWGQQPYFTEFDGRGRTVFDAHFVGPNSSYRAYRFDWHATPARPPDVAVRVRGRSTTVYASWNGATEVSSWRIVAGSTPATLSPIAGARKRSFETAVRLPRAEPYVAAQALDSRGRLLGSSTATKVQ